MIPSMTDRSAEKDRCDAQGWTPSDGEVTCDLPAGHDGLHIDWWEGWEWQSPHATTTGLPGSAPPE